MRMKSLHLKTFCPSNVCLRRSPYSDPVSDEALYWLTWKERPLVLVNPKGRAWRHVVGGPGPRVVYKESNVTHAFISLLPLSSSRSESSRQRFLELYDAGSVNDNIWRFIIVYSTYDLQTVDFQIYVFQVCPWVSFICCFFCFESQSECEWRGGVVGDVWKFLHFYIFM